MNEVRIAIFVFLCLLAASLGALFSYQRLPEHQRLDDTHKVLHHIANIFVVMTSLVLGLMITSAKSRFDAVNQDVHSYATELILLDRMLFLYGPDAADTRQKLLAYTERAADGRWTADGNLSDKTSERLLEDVGTRLRTFEPGRDPQLSLWNDMREQYRKVLELRWSLVEQAEGSLPRPLMLMVVAWLVLIFAIFGFRAPRNAVVVTGFVAAAALIGGAIYLIVDMDVPFEGPIQVSAAPLQRALTEMRR
ncbi:conserved membrane hypothetical protein [Hyphomicrobiales bacterium]|nr:conserved membrane hypothetical protein [Hyphomicrobiales bacterium]CAH1700091.1 conserved membrane hypothetical protein [Hyphomicrobiales bacterium]CAI0343852.1 DUF4239 domain-containing protein [Hyphomicrobiales bacterium]